MSIFGNNRPNTGGGIFGNQQQQQGGGNSIFGNQQQQQGNSLNNLQGNIFGGGNNQQQGNMFNNQQQNQGGIFNQSNQQQNQGGIFANQNQQRPPNNIFGGNNQQQQGSNMFNNQQQGGGIFNQQNQQQGSNNIFANHQQGGNNIFATQQQQGGNNLFGNQQQQGGNVFGNQQATLNQIQFGYTGNTTEDVRLRIKALCEKINPKNLEFIKIDQMNMYKDVKIGDLPPEIKQSLKILMNNMAELKNHVEAIKKENENLNKQAADYCTKVREKLQVYREVLAQNTEQMNLLEDVKKEVEMIKKQTNNVIIPMYNASRSHQHHVFDSPDEFSVNVAKNLLEKMIELNNRVDEIIARQCQDENDELSEEEANSLTVLQQLLEYYNNVSQKVMQFSKRFNVYKRVSVEQMREVGNYEEAMRRIDEKVRGKMEKDFKCYDLLKEVEEILGRREKREDEYRGKYAERSRGMYGDDYSQGWGRYGGII